MRASAADRQSPQLNDVITWGGGNKGNLGHSESHRKPTPLKGLEGVGPIFFDIGKFHSAAIADWGRDVYVWGLGAMGQLGRGDVISESVPRLVISLRDKQISQIVCGGYHTLALSATGILYGFGDNSRGQLGLGQNIKNSLNPQAIPGPWENDPSLTLSGISAGNFTSAAITQSGLCFIWGPPMGTLNEIPSSESASITELPQASGIHPVDWVPSLLPISEPIQAIRFGDSHCLVLSNGRVFVWGNNAFGQLGTGTKESQEHPIPLPYWQTVKDIACGRAHSVVITTEGHTFTFGLGKSGQLGTGNRDSQSSPQKISFPMQGDRIIRVVAGSNHTLTLTEKGKVFGWGSNNNYQLTGMAKDYLVPQLIEALQSLLIQQLSTAGDFSGALTGTPCKLEIFRQISIRNNEPMHQQEISLFSVTYNINGQKSALSLSVLEQLLGLNDTSKPMPDIYAVGFQELVKISGKEVAKDLADVEGPMKQFAESQLDATLNADIQNYVQIFSKQVVGTMLCVFIKKEMVLQISNIQWDQIRVGIMNKMGNKGAIAVRFEWGGEGAPTGVRQSAIEKQSMGPTMGGGAVCIVCSHYAAGQSKVGRRNNDYRQSVSKIEFPTHKGRKLTILDHENIIWLGDFNYRINFLTKNAVVQMINNGRMEELTLYDQLRMEREAGRVFSGFKEGKLHFIPSYKYDPNSTVWDSSEKDRAPGKISSHHDCHHDITILMM
eukprot:TRINITY_DN4128_c0_g2_i2.p1 TRINITY_DN4128_c0_g2~~TRINITY_DN4128_c0_g2_i2.p1  ORF type:complete len:721 (-),score=152.89 TRINITY_DN4128_c0_g2_i2:205-2367(-)